MKNAVILFLLLCELMMSCLNPNCETNSKAAREKECLLILEKEPSKSNYLRLEGRSTYSKEKRVFLDNDRYWALFKDYMSVGDTIIKKKGELILNIHKKDTILSFPWECEGKVYK
jgi:hypothetical protein